jgi:hypothetical protein
LRALVVAQTEKDWLAKLSIGRPFLESDLRYKAGREMVVGATRAIFSRNSGEPVTGVGSAGVEIGYRDSAAYSH